MREGTQPDSRQGFYREIARWKYISHPNVLPFIGVSEKLPGLDRLSIVNSWLENGNILQYVGVNPDVDRFQLVSGHKNWQTQPSDYVIYSLHKPPLVSRTSIR